MVETHFRVMLAATLKKGQEQELKFPLYATPKIDGIRMYIRDGIGYSRSNKPIPNEHIQSLIATYGENLNGFDGELIVGAPNDTDVFNKTTGYVRRKDGKPEVDFWIFDKISDEPYSQRLQNMLDAESSSLKNISFVHVLKAKLIHNLEELKAYEAEILSQGYEGVITRSPESSYKNGRSTFKEQGMVKVKRFSDAEAEIIGYEELMHNHNQANINELGLTERSSHKENLEGGNKLGALICKTPDGVEFKIGTGFTDDTRQYLWTRRHELIGNFVKYKFFEHGVKDAPRHPVFLGFRDSFDI